MTEPHDNELCPADASALDALFGEVGSDVDAARVERLESLLSLLDCEPGDDRTALIDVTLARLSREREPMLVPDDEEALDAWVASGYQETRVNATLRDRARRHASLASLVTSTPAGKSPDALIDATLERVQSAIDTQESGLHFESHRGSRRIRLADVVSVAAVLLISFSVVWPIFTSVRHRGQVAGCLNHFGTTASAMSLYAGSNRDQLPMATASLGGGAWWNVNPRKPSSNSANLFELTRGDYTDLASLSCPGNEHAPTATWDENARDWRALEEISYSYQIMFGPERPTWSKDRTVVLTDRSPVVLKAFRHEPVNPMANSPNHGGEGQHMLYNDGSVEWARAPQTPGGNNIWLPHQIEEMLEQLSRGELDLQGTETPSSATDVFVGP